MITKESRSLLCFMIHLKKDIKICDAKSRNYTLYETYQFVFPIFPYNIKSASMRGTLIIFRKKNVFT